MGIPILGQEPRELPSEGPRIRLLFCFKCKTLEEIPDFQGNPEDDYLLQITSEKHETTGIPHQGQLMDVPISLWSVPEVKDEITKQIYAKGAPGLDSISPGFYAAKSNFAADAMSCWSKHLRPKDGCSDYGSESKLLLPDTERERRDAGLPSAREGGPKNYLCQFCPVHTVVVTKKRQAAGMYK